MSYREEVQNLLSLKGDLHTDEGHVGDEPGFRLLRDGRKYILGNDADGIIDVTFVRLAHLDASREQKLDKIAAQMIKPSKEASCKTIVRYLDYLPKEKTFIDKIVLDVAWDLLLALAYLHGTGTAHGDVRLPNVFPFPLENSRVRYKLFGHGFVPEVISHQLRDAGYLAPEFRSRGKWYDFSTTTKPTPESDVWMLGMVLWHCHHFGVYYSGRRSARERWDSDILVQPDLTDGSEDGVDSLETRNHGCKPSSHRLVEDLLHKMLIPDPNRRWSAADLLEELKLQKCYTGEEGDMEQDLNDLQPALKGEKYDIWRKAMAKASRFCEDICFSGSVEDLERNLTFVGVMLVLSGRWV
ncbi:hypothetical protein CORC01_08173 [Colletotrichum orchidophilum]|uniref:non-specific serine/threonine protein kinase n=1 Tax=Colletotrichum orchidophilum TaxID=1209926 RepID=A0A1G4B5L4_9PEZI|nr:uncharacterized protein CORC01_08173 [Colletotrichum orchidophilum]OHE96575.1 hypothetical protein CORC01_08173 [Colletotrichum orchidophilum]